MSMIQIAAIAGVVVLLLLLLKMRHDRQKAGRAERPEGGSPRRGRRRRDRRSSDEEAMPFAAASTETAATSMRMPPPAPTAGAPFSPDEASVDELDPPQPVTEQAVETPADHPEEPVAPPSQTLSATVPPPAAPEPTAVPFAEPHAASDDQEIVIDPGWPMPGDLDMPFADQAGPEAMASRGSDEAAPAQPAAFAAADDDESWLAASAPETGEPAQPAEDWMPSVEARSLGAEALAEAPSPDIEWQPAPEAAPAVEEWASSAEAPLIAAEAPAEPEHAPSQPAEPEWLTREIPVVETGPAHEGWAPPLPETEAPAAVPPVAAEAELPPVAAEAELPPVAAEAELPPLAAEAPAEVPPLVADAPAAGWPAVDEIAEAMPAPVAAPVTEDAWWDEPEPAPAAEPEDEARGGRFALGGFAQGPAQEGLTAVAFRSPLPGAPAAEEIDLSVEGTINCDASSVEVIAEEGFAPSREGFTMKVRAASPGPFMVSGTFRVR